MLSGVVQILAEQRELRAAGIRIVSHQLILAAGAIS